MHKASPTNKMVINKQFKRLNVAKEYAIAAGVLFLAMCLIENVIPHNRRVEIC